LNCELILKVKTFYIRKKRNVIYIAEVFMNKIYDTKSSEELVEILKEIAENSFLTWYVNPEIMEEAVKELNMAFYEGRL